MTPDAVHACVVLDLPAGLIDGAAAPAVLQGKPGGIGQVERDHVVVHVAAEIDGNGNALSQAEVPAGTDIVERVALEHDVVDSLGRVRGLQDGDRVVAGIAVEKSQASRTARRPYFGEVRDTEAEEIAVEA